jgi:four helix bundle suffix protein
MNDDEKLIPLHGGYRKLKSFQVSQLVYDVTVRFCERYIERFSRTRDQMVQAARSGVQNIAEGSQASGTSKKTELRLTNVARASLEELRLDYEDFLRQRGMEKWDDHSLLRQELVDSRCRTADEVAMWVKDAAKRTAQNTASNPSTMSGVYAMISANAALVLINVACGLLNRQITALANEFEQKGGFSERMYRIRSNSRK